MHKNSKSQRFPERPKGPTHDFFVRDKTISSSFYDIPLYGSPKFLHLTNGQRQKLPEITKLSFGTVRQKNFDNFW